MKILLDIGHPAHVHLFKNFIWEMQRRGHEFRITARDKEVSLTLLNKYGFKYVNRGSGFSGILGKAFGMILIDLRILKVARQFQPDLMMGGTGNLYIAQTSKIVRKPSIIFDDTEHAKFQLFMVRLFADKICTPSCYSKNLGIKQVRYNGYHELAYLHPKFFTPTKTVLEELALLPGERLFILRFVSWGASHDVGQKGISDGDKLRLIEGLSKKGRVIITSESSLPLDFEKYRMHVPSEHIHHLLHFADMYTGEGATMASEAAVLGTPSLYINTLQLGYLKEQETRYGLTMNFTESGPLVDKALELAKDERLKLSWAKKREWMLSEKVDVTAWMVKFVEDYVQGLQS
jgi:uncharacterized protein